MLVNHAPNEMMASVKSLRKPPEGSREPNSIFDRARAGPTEVAALHTPH